MKQNDEFNVDELFKDIRRLNLRFNIYRIVIYLILIFIFWWLPPYTYRKMVKEPMERRFEEIDREWARRDSVHQARLDSLRQGEYELR